MIKLDNILGIEELNDVDAESLTGGLSVNANNINVKADNLNIAVNEANVDTVQFGSLNVDI